MDIEAHLSQYISQELLDGSVAVTAEDMLLADGLVDSLGMMRLVGYIDDTFGVEVPPEDVVIENFSTIARMVEYLRGKVS